MNSLTLKALAFWYIQSHLQTFGKEPMYEQHMLSILPIENGLSAHGVTELLCIQLYLSGAHHVLSWSLVSGETDST